MKKYPRVILLIETSRAYGRGLLRGIAKYSRFNGPWSFYNEPRGRNDVLPELVEDWEPDGIIMRDTKVNRHVLEMGIPVIVSVDLKDVELKMPSISGDDENIGLIAAEYLLSRGFKRFAFCGFTDVYWSTIRKDVFRREIEKKGYEFFEYEKDYSFTQNNWETEQNDLAQWLESLPKPIAIFACNDDRGQHAIEACKNVGLHVPDDVAILAVDNDEMICDLTDPPLSSIVQNTERAGYEAAELLDKLMNGEEVENKNIIVKPTHVVTRQSTDILSIEDRELNEALRFIRLHAKEPIQVTDVVNAVNLSRRVLEKRFRKILGHSVLSEIRRVRVNIIAKMLVETNMPILQIAKTLGYTNVEHIARYFRLEKGMSPLAYRKQYGYK